MAKLRGLALRGSSLGMQNTCGRCCTEEQRTYFVCTLRFCKFKLVFGTWPKWSRKGRHAHRWCNFECDTNTNVAGVLLGTSRACSLTTTCKRTFSFCQMCPCLQFLTSLAACRSKSSRFLRCLNRANCQEPHVVVTLAAPSVLGRTLDDHTYWSSIVPASSPACPSLVTA